MKYYVYVLQCQKDGSLYKGLTKDLSSRIQEHNAGHVKHTKSRLPVKLIHQEELPSREEARRREKFLKSGSGRSFLKKIIPL